VEDQYMAQRGLGLGEEDSETTVSYEACRHSFTILALKCESTHRSKCFFKYIDMQVKINPSFLDNGQFITWLNNFSEVKYLPVYNPDGQ